MITDDDLLLNQFIDHFEAAMTGDWAVYLEGCSQASRAGKTTEDTAARWARSMDIFSLTDQGMEVAEIEVLVLDGISAVIWADLLEFGEARYLSNQKAAWMWAKEDDRWYDTVCSLGAF